MRQSVMIASAFSVLIGIAAIKKPAQLSFNLLPNMAGFFKNEIFIGLYVHMWIYG
jgi:hypothetical protein